MTPASKQCNAAGDSEYLTAGGCYLQRVKHATDLPACYNPLPSIDRRYNDDTTHDACNVPPTIAPHAN